MTNEQKINLIGQKILLLSNQIDAHRHELDSLRHELEQLKQQGAAPVMTQQPVIVPVAEPVIVPLVEKAVIDTPQFKVETAVPVAEIQNIHNASQEYRAAPKKPAASNLEERIGSKIFSIIGIIALVLGVSIGVKYAIDKDLINETGRLVLGYAAGIILLSIAFIYKKKYDVFSAVLLSGAMAIMYFTTFLGYSYYHMYPAPVAFCVMAVFTGFTVFAAHVYNYEVIALIGLVGGYALPPLLSTGSGEIQYMFGFMLLLNLGVLALSFLKYWKFVNHVAYGLTWLIFVSWMLAAYKPELYFGRTMFFATAFYLLFYLSFIAYKLFRNKPFSAWDIVLVLSNSMIYFGVGYNALNTGSNSAYERYQGLFCIFNALVHLAFALLCRKKELADRSIFHFIIAMVISFLTIAVPIQLNGNFVTLIWFAEMLVLLWMWRYFRSKVYIILGSALSVLALFSLVNDWSVYYNHYTYSHMELLLPSLTNRYMVTGLCAIFSYWFARHLLRDEAGEADKNELRRVMHTIVLIMGVVVTYFTFANEISLYFNKQYLLSETTITGSYGYSYSDFDHSWRNYEFLWILGYSAAFVAAAGIINMKWFKNKIALYISWGFTLFILLLMVTLGLLSIEDLRPEHRTMDSTYSALGYWDYNFRYVYFVFAALALFMIYQYRNNGMLKPLRPVNTWLFHLCILVLLSNELTNLMARLHPGQIAHYKTVSYRMGYTVLWGVYSMALIAYGIVRQQKLLRVIAISLFGATILKLAIDALSMTRGYQLIVFITIGVILLIVSFMYQKFKPLLFGDTTKDPHESQDAV